MAPRLSKARYGEEFERAWRAYCAALGASSSSPADDGPSSAPASPGSPHTTYLSCKRCTHGLVPAYAAAKAAFHAPENGFHGWLHADADALLSFPVVAEEEGKGEGGEEAAAGRKKREREEAGPEPE